MASFSAAIVVLLVASCAAVALATTFDVGDGHGWETGIDYTDWTFHKTFAVGDTLVFNYTRRAHTVTEVDESGYDACSARIGIPLTSDDSGATTVTLTTPGVHYFICSKPGHCANGMKLAVTVTVTVAGVGLGPTFDVSDGHGWETGIDYTDWTFHKTFVVGDTLVFNYTRRAHTVTEVDESGYDACSAGNSLMNDDGGSTAVVLTTPGVHYFICSIPGHCANGMKLAVTVTVAGVGLGSTTGAAIPASAAGGFHVPTMSAVVAVAAGALIVLALF